MSSINQQIDAAVSALERWKSVKWEAQHQLPPFSGSDMTKVLDAGDELLAEVEQWKEKERVLVRNRVEWQQRAEAAEAERDRLAWMLERIRDSEYDRIRLRVLRERRGHRVPRGI